MTELEQQVPDTYRKLQHSSRELGNAVMVANSCNRWRSFPACANTKPVAASSRTWLG